MRLCRHSSRGEAAQELECGKEGAGYLGSPCLAVVCASLPHSNAFIARSYAKLILNFLRDGVTAGRVDPGHPVYIVEVGSGSGKFGFLLLKALLEKHRLAGIPLSCFKYDVTRCCCGLRGLPS